jgi:radical SAM superfamily enzyme YgiQ (UPF0313 family)
MDILLTHGYFLSEDASERRIMKPYPPLGILYISSFLKSRGFDVGVFDTTFSTKEDFRRAITSQRPPVVGIYANLMTKRNVLAQIRMCKDAGLRVVVGGPDVPEYAEDYVRHGADAAVLGEGEATLADLLEQWRKDAPVPAVSGIVAYDDAGTIRRTAPRELLRDLDSLPFPDRDAIDTPRYVSTWKEHHGMGSVSLICARGCPYTCTWCSRSVFGDTHRRRSVTNVVDEIELILARWSPDMLWFADDVFTIHHKWFHEFHAEMRRRNIRIPFECISRADRLNEEILAKMAEIGAFRIWYGSESGSQRILDAMERSVSVEQIRQTTKAAQRCGIQTGLFVMLGYPGEELRDIDETVEHLKRTNPDVFLTTVAYPIRGTSFFHSVRDRIIPDGAWDQTTDRMVKFKGRYSDRFYWFANRYLVNEVRRHTTPNGRLLSYVKAKLARLGMEVTKSQSS